MKQKLVSRLAHLSVDRLLARQPVRQSLNVRMMLVQILVIGILWRILCVSLHIDLL